MKNSGNTFFNKFHIGAYFLQKNARTDEHVRDMRDCGIDLAFGIDNDHSLLDLFYKYGISAVISGVVPSWFGGNGDNAGLMSQINAIEKYAIGIELFNDHPAVVGIDIGDEPSANDFPYCNEITELIKKQLPDKLPYLNIYPSYGMLASNDKAQSARELGRASYHEYIESYCKSIDLPYLSFDHYVYTSQKDRFFSDLSTAASHCKESGKKLFVVLQVNSRDSNTFLSEKQLYFQAFSAMAYGATAITWACYSAGWWYNHVLDADGNKTEQYEKLKSVNHTILSLASEYLRYRWVDTEQVRSGPRSDFDVFKDLSATSDVLIGRFLKDDEHKAIFVSPIDHQDTSACTLSFGLDDVRRARLHKRGGAEWLIPDDDGIYRVYLKSKEACFITVE